MKNIIKLIYQEVWNFDLIRRLEKLGGMGGNGNGNAMLREIIKWGILSVMSNSSKIAHKG